jgi:outer membrane protein TolC
MVGKWPSFVVVLVLLAAWCCVAFGEGEPGGGSAPAATDSTPSETLDDDEGLREYKPSGEPTVHAHRYSLAECLALADRNFPRLWAARARLAYAHAQLEEARWTPWFQWSATSMFGVAPALTGIASFPQSSIASMNVSQVPGLLPFFGFGVSGVVPLYTFGKIDSALEAAQANVRVSEWDMEKSRMEMRLDVRRAYYGLALARDIRVVVAEAMDRLAQAIRGVDEKITKGDPSVTDVDRLRLEAYRQEVTAQSLQAPKGESQTMAALRFLTGVQTSFDVVDEPLKKPDRPLVNVAQYLEAARLFRADINMARSGVVARRALVDYNRARLFPDIGLGLSADYRSTPSAVQQNNAWASDPFNHFSYGFAFGVRWSLDLLPQAARIQEAESQLEEIRANERLALGGAMVEVEKAYADALEAKQREEAWDTTEHKAKEWIAIANDHIELGTWDERTLLEPLRVYGNARVQHLTALMDYNVAMSNLALVSGWDSAAPSGT